MGIKSLIYDHRSDPPENWNKKRIPDLVKRKKKMHFSGKPRKSKKNDKILWGQDASFFMRITRFWFDQNDSINFIVVQNYVLSCNQKINIAPATSTILQRYHKLDNFKPAKPQVISGIRIEFIVWLQLMFRSKVSWLNLATFGHIQIIYVAV